MSSTTLYSNLFTSCTRCIQLHKVSRAFSISSKSRKSFCSKLESRNILSLSGTDAHSFLQGLVSNNVPEKFEPDQAVFAAFLSAPGRVLHDVFITSCPDNEDSILIDSPANVVPPLRSYINRFVLRRKVKVKDVTSQYAVWAHWNDEGKDVAPGEGARRWKDERSPSMGWRSLLPSTSQPSADSIVPSEWYRLHRILQGVAQVPDDIVPNGSLPLQSNLDYMGGVDYQKGCYVGQELTARTHYKGIIRKRIMPVRLFREGEDIPLNLSDLTTFPEPIIEAKDYLPLPQSSLLPFKATGASRASASSKLTSSIGMRTHDGKEAFVGLAMIRLELLSGANEGGVFRVEDAAEGETAVSSAGGKDDNERGIWLVKPFVPGWWPSFSETKDQH